MTTQPESTPRNPPPELVRRYMIVFILATLFGGAMVFFAVASRRYQLIEQAKAKRAAGEEVQPFQTPEMEAPKPPKESTTPPQ